MGSELCKKDRSTVNHEKLAVSSYSKAIQLNFKVFINREYLCMYNETARATSIQHTNLGTMQITANLVICTVSDFTISNIDLTKARECSTLTF